MQYQEYEAGGVSRLVPHQTMAAILLTAMMIRMILLLDPSLVYTTHRSSILSFLRFVKENVAYALSAVNSNTTRKIMHKTEGCVRQ
mmetsp:Transcript_10847/g.17974  ORF Transcript_10847/g.17974 Transcript_10847/m.17974 type:complete len:86 (-) Transcript_10847:19-276(-)